MLMKEKLNEILKGTTIIVPKPSKPCKRCGRKLTNSTSLERGYGPVCWKKLQENQSNPRRKISSSSDFASSALGNLFANAKVKCLECKIWDRCHSKDFLERNPNNAVYCDSFVDKNE